MTSNFIISYIKFWINLELTLYISPMFGCTVDESWSLSHSVGGFALLKVISTHISPMLKCKWLKHNSSRECSVIEKAKLFQSAWSSNSVKPKWKISTALFCYSMSASWNTTTTDMPSYTAKKEYWLEKSTRFWIISKILKSHKQIFWFWKSTLGFSIMLHEFNEKDVPRK